MYNHRPAKPFDVLDTVSAILPIDPPLPYNLQILLRP
jgi:hypothetical protein